MVYFMFRSALEVSSIVLNVSHNVQIINVIRNPRDVCMSSFNHYRIINNYTGDLDLLTDMFLKNKGPLYGPFFVNVLSYWNRRHQDNILIVHYEEMQKDLPSVVRKIGKFLGKELSNDDVSKLCDHVSIDNMKKNPMCNFETTLKVSYFNF